MSYRDARVISLMFISILVFCVAVTALAIAGFVIFRHWKEIRLLDPLSIKEEQERQKREAMIHRRFDRLRSDQRQALRKVGREIARAAGRAYERMQQRLQTLESVYKQAKSPFAGMAPSGRERIKTLLKEAFVLSRDQKWADAERRYLEILSIDAYQVDAYKGLGQLYVKQRLYPQAKETLEFVLKLKKADGVVYAALAEVAEALGDVSAAEEMLTKAVEIGSRHAQYHAALAEFYVKHHQIAKAWPAAKRASDLEPTNLKYVERALEVACGLGDVSEARRRYDKLRLLLIDDRARLQMWREKVEALEKH